MKFILAAALLASQTFLSAEEAVAMNLSKPQMTLSMPYQAPRAWLGLQVSKPDATITAHVPSLPPGIGFLIKSIDPGGPAEKAGLVEYDLIWKIGEQMLVNEAQLAILLRLFKPGEEITLHGFRGGKAFEVKLNLGEAPASTRTSSNEIVENSIMFDSSTGPMRVVKVAEKSASFSAEGARATVRREGNILKVKIEGSSGEIIFEGDFAHEEKFDKVPEVWRRRIEALSRTLNQTLDGSMMPRRQPRPRVIPPPAPQTDPQS